MKNKINQNEALNKTIVNRSYFDKEGNEIKLGDILFYSEFDGKNKDYHYADGIYLVIEKEGELAAKCKVMTMTNAANFIDYDEPIENVLKLESYFKNGICKEMLKIGNIENDAELLNAFYANKTYSIS